MSKVSIYCGDCITLLNKMKLKANFIFADPPFNIGQDYAEYVDRKNADEYWRFMESWIITCCNSLAPDGVIALHGPDNLVESYLVHMRELSTYSVLKRIAWINWHYRFGQCHRENWIDSRCHCLIYARSDNYTWNPEAVLVDSDRVKYGDKRVHETKNGGKRLPFTIWGTESDGPYWGRVSGAASNKERRPGHPNQLPEKYLERLIRAYTNEGDLVVDPFGGSGTTAVVAQALNRNCVSIDVSKPNCQSILKRLKQGAVRVSL